MRGKQKLVSGDKQRMPTSSYFTIAVAALNDDEYYEAEKPARLVNQNLASCESVLGFADKSNFRTSYLDVHIEAEIPA